MSDLTPIKEGLEAHYRAFDAWKSKHNEQLDSLFDRVETLESKHGAPKPSGAKAQQAAPEFKTFETARGRVFEMPNRTKMADAIPPETPPEISFERWLGAIMAGERCEDKAALQFTAERKQMVTTSTGVLIPEEFQSHWIDLIRAQSVLNASGMTTVTMNAKTQTHSAVATDPAASWHTEAGAISADNPTFATRQLVAQTLVTRCQGSVELVQDSPDFGRQLANVMAKAMAAELDRVGLMGSGTPPEPQGIYGASGVADITAAVSIVDFSDILAGVRALLDANVPIEVAAANVVMAPRTWAKYEGLATGISGDKTQLPRPRSLENTAFRVTTQIPTNLGAASPPDESAMFLGDFRDLVLGVRREASVESLKLTTYASNLVIEFVGYLRADFLIRRPASFVTISGVNP